MSDSDLIVEWRRLAAAAIADTHRPGWPYGGSGEWTANVEALLGGPTGDYCGAIHPAKLVVILDELERGRDRLDKLGSALADARLQSAGLLRERDAATVDGYVIGVIDTVMQSCLEGMFAVCGRPAADVSKEIAQAVAEGLAEMRPDPLVIEGARARIAQIKEAQRD